MSTGAEFRAELRSAQAALRQAQRNKRGKRPRGIERADAGHLGYRREPPCECGGECTCIGTGKGAETDAAAGQTVKTSLCHAYQPTSGGVSVIAQEYTSTEPETVYSGKSM